LTNKSITLYNQRGEAFVVKMTAVVEISTRLYLILYQKQVFTSFDLSGYMTADLAYVSIM
jgi:hypothetical protein